MERVDYALLFRWVVGAEIDFKASHSIPYLGNRDPLCQAGIPNVLFDQIAQQAVSIRPGHLAVPRQASVWRSASLLAAGCRGAGQVESAHVRSQSVCPGEAPRSRPSVGAPREGGRSATWEAPGARDDAVPRQRGCDAPYSDPPLTHDYRRRPGVGIDVHAQRSMQHDFS